MKTIVNAVLITKTTETLFLATWKKKEPEPTLSLRIPWNVREIGAEMAASRVLDGP